MAKGLNDFNEEILQQIYGAALKKQLEEDDERFKALVKNTYGGFKEWTTEQQAQYDKRLAEIKDWDEKFQRLYDLESVKNPVLQLHKKDSRDECEGCDFGGYEGEPPSWPCRTVNLILTGDANFHFEAPTPMPRSEYIRPSKGTVTYTISPRNLEFGA